jgi:hypothetical protein
MHRVGTEQAIEVARRYAFDRGLDWSDGLGQPALGIFSEKQAVGAAGGILECRLDRMQTEQPKRTVFAGYARSMGIPSCRFGVRRRAMPGTGKTSGALLVAPRFLNAFVCQDWPRSLT